MTRQVNANEVSLEPYDLDPSEVVDGTPTTSELEVFSMGDVQVGVWQITAGTVTDVEKDEVFVVLTGRGTITFSDGEVVGLEPGALVRLHAGETTVWKIDTALRKVYVV